MSLISELEDVLREEQELLLSGRLSELETLVQRKSELAQRLAKAKPEVSEIHYRDLAKKADHNEALLDAARRGLQAAIRQIHQPSGAELQNTYSKSGERRSLSRAPSSFTQKL